MTLTSVLNDQQSSLDLLAGLIEQNKKYVTTYGYPSGKACPHCGKETFATIRELDQLAAAPPGSNLAHNHCVEIAALKNKLAELEAKLAESVRLPDGVKLHIVEQRAQGGESDPANPDAPPEPSPTPTPDPAQPEPKEQAC